jgi:hypothetical protein
VIWEDEVVGELEVGRKGGATGSVVVVEVLVEVEVDEKQSLLVPHIMSVAQHPPPREAGQDWKPDVHVEEGLWMELVVLGVDVVVATGGGTTTTFVEVLILVEGGGEDDEDEDEDLVVAVAVGVTTMVAVDMYTPVHC